MPSQLSHQTFLTINNRPKNWLTLLLGVATALILWGSLGGIHELLLTDTTTKRLVNVFFGGWAFGLIQLTTYCAFFWAVFSLIAKDSTYRYQQQGFQLKLLESSHHDHLLNTEDIQKVREKIATLSPTDHSLLLVSTLKKIADSKFRSGTNATELTSLLQEQINIAMTHMDTSYSTIRYLAWAIPSIGFIGTVLGISAAMGKANEAIEVVTSLLGVAFDTTLVSLLLSLVLMFFIHRTQEREETQLIEIESYCLDHFVNRLYTKESS